MTATRRGPATPDEPRFAHGDDGSSFRLDGRAYLIRALAVVLLLVPTVLAAVSFWPGHMNYDTLTQVDEVRSGNVSDRHAWLLLELWRVVWPLGVGPGCVLAGTVIVLLAGSYLVLRAALGPIGSALGAVTVALLPQNFGSLALVGRDMWFAALLLLAFGLLIRAAERTGRAQVGLLVCSAVAAVLAQASRQNAITAIALFFVGVAVVVVMRQGPGARFARYVRGRMRSAGAYILVAAAAPTVIAVLLAVAGSALGVRASHPEQYLYIYDLAALSERQDRLLLGSEVFPAQNLGLLEERFIEDNVTTIVVPPDPLVPVPLPEGAFDELSSDWRQSVIDSPLDYLAVRSELFLRQIAVTQPPTQIYHPGIDGNPFGFEIRFNGANERAKQYVEAFADERLNGNLLHATWLYLLISLAAAIVLLRARPVRLKLIGLMALSAIAYQAGLFLGAMGVGLRLEDPVRPLALLAAIAAAAHLVDRHRAQTRGQSTVQSVPGSER